MAMASNHEARSAVPLGRCNAAGLSVLETHAVFPNLCFAYGAEALRRQTRKSRRRKRRARACLSRNEKTFLGGNARVKVRPMKTKTLRWVFAFLVLSATCNLTYGAETAALALAIKAASQGRLAEPAMVEIEGFYRDRFQAVRVFSRGVGIADNQRQFVVAQGTVRSVFKALDWYDFASMPEQFGGKPRPVNKPELRSAVTVRLGPWEKTVIQMRDGEQSRKFAKLVKSIFTNLEPEMRQGISIASFNEGLQGIVEGRLAPEILSLRLVWEELPKTFAVYAVSGLHVTWTPPGGGEVRRYWLEEQEAQKLAKVLLALEPNSRSARFSWPKYVSLEAEVLNHRWSLEGRAWAGSVGERERALAAHWESVQQDLRQILKEAMLER